MQKTRGVHMSSIPSFFGSRHQMPDVLQAYVLDHLSQQDLGQVTLVSRQAKDFVRLRHRELSLLRDPGHLGHVKSYQQLTLAQKLELEFIRFNDRPLWHKALIVAGTILFSPLILIYHSPKIWNWVATRFLTPFCNKLIQMTQLLYEKVIRPTGEFILQNILHPMIQTIDSVLVRLLEIGESAVRVLYRYGEWFCLKVAIPFIQWAHTHIWVPLKEAILIPAARIINRLLFFVFTTLPENLYFHVILPLNEKVITPTVKVGKVVLKGVCVTFPTKIYAHILTPIGQGLKGVGKFVYNEFLTPIGQIIQKVALFVLNRLLLPIWVPLANIGKTILKGVCITLPIQIYEHILTPLGQVVQKVALFVQNRIMIPIGEVLQAVPNLFRR